jgi:hypothetical protein
MVGLNGTFQYQVPGTGTWYQTCPGTGSNKKNRNVRSTGERSTTEKHSGIQ